MFRRILIANRGEIACRVARTCRRLGIESVAVHSRADAAALHVRAADRALALDGAGPADGYLDAAQIVAAAQRAGADAIHPGYGFLSENAGFAAACADAGVAFVGPDADTIRAMGDKARARAIARGAGVAVVPGVEEPEGAGADRDAALCAAAAGLGVPLMVKACAGGGGRGMRRVDRADELSGAIALARREAMAGFGDDRLIVERCIERPRHVEVQVLGDGHGNIVHLHERDCSIQRRHQKLVEEAPAPGLDADTRAALHAAALALARAIGYRNAGTVEFVLDPRDGAFFFLEMNTRLQVEHPVTEAILGLDLVEWQLRVAAGEALPFAQEDLVPRGWAMEARINAEDPAHDFRPATGTLAAWRPAAGEGIRVDSGVGEGTRVEPFYDALLAKLVVHGRDRADAAARLAEALRATALPGVRSNAAFLAALVSVPDFVAGRVSTGFIHEQFPGGWSPPLGRDEHAMAAAAVLARRGAAEADGPWRSLAGFRVLAAAGHPGRWRILLDDGEGAPLAVWVRADGEAWRMAVADAAAPPPQAGALVAVDGAVDGDALEVTVAGRRHALRVLERGGRLHLSGEAGWHGFRALDAHDAPRAAGGGSPGLDAPLTAPVPGVVASVEVAPGDAVAAGAPLVVLESMKMYQTLSAPAPARVSAVHCAAGDAVALGQALVTLEAPGDDAAPGAGARHAEHERA